VETGILVGYICLKRETQKADRDLNNNREEGWGGDRGRQSSERSDEKNVSPEKPGEGEEKGDNNDRGLSRWENLRDEVTW